MQDTIELTRDSTTENPFLTGIHAPMREELEIHDLAVTGTIPAGLDGRYLRIGPNPIAPDATRHHWFVGEGMFHGLAIADGKALWYKNRFVRSPRAAATLGLDPAAGAEGNPRAHNVNTNVVKIGERTFALIEAGGAPLELSFDLETQAYNGFDGTLQGAFAAHPHHDPLTGEHHAITYDGHRPDLITHVVVDAAGKVIREEPIHLPHGPMIHDCAFTRRYMIILDLPVAFSMKAAQAGSIFPYHWNADLPARVGLLPRNGTQADIIWCPVDPCFAFHVANAYDRADGKVVLDLCVYESMFHAHAIGPDARSRGFERWVIDPEAQAVEISTVDAAPQEFPRPDERRFGQPYRYAYVVALPQEGADAFFGSSRLYRHDLWEGTRAVHDFGPGRVPGEFVFVPKAEDSAEEEGWMMGLVIDAASDRTDLVILDAARFEDAPVATIHLPHRVPPGFHGNWIAGR